MTTAILVLEALRATCEELAAASRAESRDFQTGDDESRAQAVGAFGAYRAIATRMADQLAAGLTDADQEALTTALAERNAYYTQLDALWRTFDAFVKQDPSAPALLIQYLQQYQPLTDRSAPLQ